MENKYLEKLAQVLQPTTTGDVIRGTVSQGWNKAHIAGEYDQDPNGVVGKHFTGGLRQFGRSIVEGIGGSVAAGGVGGMVGKAMSHSGLKGARAVAEGIGAVGGLAGGLHGLYASSKNQSDEMHKQFAGQKLLKDHTKTAFLLEKLAANRLKQHMQGQGMQFGDSRSSGATNRSIAASTGTMNPSTRIATGDKMDITSTRNSGFMGLGKPITTVTGQAPTGKTRVTGDVLAQNKPAVQRLAGAAEQRRGFKALATQGLHSANPVAPVAEQAGKGILGKAVSMLKKNPVGAAVGAAGLALGAGIAARGRSQPQQPQQFYPQYG